MIIVEYGIHTTLETNERREFQWFSVCPKNASHGGHRSFMASSANSSLSTMSSFKTWVAWVERPYTMWAFDQDIISSINIW
jgi:hypothetical protein